MKSFSVFFAALSVVFVKLLMMVSMVDFDFTAPTRSKFQVIFPEISYWVDKKKPEPTYDPEVKYVESIKPSYFQLENAVNIDEPEPISLKKNAFALRTANISLDNIAITHPQASIPNYQGLTAESVFGSPVIALRPRYPVWAARDRVEGHVIIAISVNPDGTVSEDSIEIVESVPKGAFDRSVLKVATKLKFKPKIVNGVAQAASDVLFLYKFNLPKFKPGEAQNTVRY